MKLVRISHTRCREWDGTEYVLAPEEWADDFIDRQIEEAKEELLDEARAVSTSPLKPSHAPPYTEHPDETVREVQEAHAEQVAVYKGWREKNARLGRSLHDRLIERGFHALGTDEAGILEVRLDWGHNHGLTLNYRHATVI